MTELEKAEVERLWLLPMSVAKIAQTLNFTIGAVNGYLSRHGFKRGRLGALPSGPEPKIKPIRYYKPRAHTNDSWEARLTEKYVDRKRRLLREQNQRR